MEQMTGIEPAFSAWEADALPLSYICIFSRNILYYIRFARSCQALFEKNLSLFS